MSIAANRIFLILAIQKHLLVENRPQNSKIIKYPKKFYIVQLYNNTPKNSIFAKGPHSDKAGLESPLDFSFACLRSHAHVARVSSGCRPCLAWWGARCTRAPPRHLRKSTAAHGAVLCCDTGCAWFSCVSATLPLFITLQKWQCIPASPSPWRHRNVATRRHFREIINHIE